jgi:hypothetical protein
MMFGSIEDFQQVLLAHSRVPRPVRKPLAQEWAEDRAFEEFMKVALHQQRPENRRGSSRKPTAGYPTSG